MSCDERSVLTAAWLGVVIDRLERGVAPWPRVHEIEGNDGSIDLDRYVGKTLFTSPREDRHWGRVYTPAFEPLYDRLHALLRGKPKEEEIWGAVLVYGEPLPSETVLKDLVDRFPQSSLECSIGHFPTSDKFLWFMSDKVDEALLTLGKRRWLNERYTADQVEEVLHSFPNHEWLLHSLAKEPPTDAAKLAVLLPYLRGLDDGDKWVETALATAEHWGITLE